MCNYFNFEIVLFSNITDILSFHDIFQVLTEVIYKMGDMRGIDQHLLLEKFQSSVNVPLISVPIKINNFYSYGYFTAKPINYIR